MEDQESTYQEVRVLIISNKPPYPPTDGGCIATLNLAMGLDDAGVKVTVASMSTPKHSLATEEIPTSILAKLNLKVCPINTSINSLDLTTNLLFSRTPYIYKRFISPKFKDFITKILQGKSYDIVQLEGLYLTPYIETIRQYSNAKIAYRPHNLEHEVWYRNALNQTNLLTRYYYNNLAKRILHLEKELIDQYDLLIPISERDSNQMNIMGNTKPSMTIPAGFAPYKLPRHEHLDSEVDISNIGFIGALDWIPNQDGITWFIDNIWPGLKHDAQGSNRTLHVAGRNAPKWLVRKLKETPQIVFHGEVPNAQEFMMRYPILVVPLNAGGGMRVKIVEAMMLGRIVITTNTGVEGIKANHGEHLFVANSLEEHLKVFDTLENEPKTIRKISKNASLFALEHYCYDKLAVLLKGFYINHL